MFDLYPGVQVVALLHITAQYFSPLSLQDLLEHIIHALVQYVPQPLVQRQLKMFVNVPRLLRIPGILISTAL